MIIDFKQQTPSSCYHLMTQTVVPRPIAWVLSENEPPLTSPVQPSYNLAPFSFFNAICSDPPLLMLSVGKKSDGTTKDTRVNLLSGRDFVIHIAQTAQANALSRTSAELAYGDSEVTANELSLTEFPGSPVPRLEECQVAYHCTLYDSHTLGPNEQTIIYAEICQMYVGDNAIKQQDNRYVIDALAIDPLLRLGANQYATMGKPFTLKRP